MTEPIRGKVACVLNGQEIVINIGIVDGVTVDMDSKVMDLNGEDIKDPDTNEVLGSIERPKIKVRVTHVQEKLSVASTYRTETVNIGAKGGFRSICPIPYAPKWVKKYETLRVEDKSLFPIEEYDSFVKVGDPVVQVKGN